MTPSLELIDGAMVISPSQLELVRTCPALWWYRYGWRRVRDKAVAARDGGSAFDKALNIRYRALGSAAVTPAIEQAMLTAIDKGFAGLDLPLEEYRTPTRYREVIQAYNQHWREEPFEVLAVQLPFMVELGWVNQSIASIQLPARPMRILLHGILDLLVRNRDSGMVLIMDTKTANEWNEGRAAEYENHAQMKAYSWAIPEVRKQAITRGVNEATLTGLPPVVHGCMLNSVVIRKPLSEATLVKAAKSEAYAAKLKPRTEFKRMIFSYSQERLEEWRRDALMWVEMALGWVARGQFPQNEKSCAFHYGSRCGYLDVCALPREQRPLMLGSDMFKDYERGPFVGGALSKAPSA